MDQVQRYMRNVVGDAAAQPMQQAFLDAAAAMLDWFEAHTAVRLAGRSYSPHYYPHPPAALPRPRGCRTRRAFDGPGDVQWPPAGGAFLPPARPAARVHGARRHDGHDGRCPAPVVGHEVVPVLARRHETGAAPCGRPPARLPPRHAPGAGQRAGRAPVQEPDRAPRAVLAERAAGADTCGRRQRAGRDGRDGAARWQAGPGARAPRRRARHRGLSLERKAGGGTLPPADRAMVDGAAGQQRRWHQAGARAGRHAGHRPRPSGLLGTGVDTPAARWHRTALPPFGLGARQARLDGGQPRGAALRQRIGFVPRVRSGHVPLAPRRSRHSRLPGVRRAVHRALGPGPGPAGRAGYLHRADTLRGLAQLLGLDPDALERSAERFSGFAASGEDPDFGKGGNAYNRYLGAADQTPNPCLGPLQTGPFYAVKVYPGDIGTAVGLRCNENAQVLGAGDRPITGLYAVGNDLHSVMGGQYPAPGITLGPAMTFGWIAARHIARQPARYETTA